MKHVWMINSIRMIYRYLKLNLFILLKFEFLYIIFQKEGSDFTRYCTMHNKAKAQSYHSSLYVDSVILCQVEACRSLNLSSPSSTS